MGPRIDSDKENKSNMGVKVPGATKNVKFSALNLAPVERLSELGVG